VGGGVSITPETPVTGITELPAGKQKETGKSSFDNDELIRHVELLGARVAWSRASVCPCRNFTGETQQPDPTCVKCQGRGFFFFGPDNYTAPEQAGTLTQLQQAILADDGAAVIRTLFTRSTHITDPYDLLGTWTRGSMFVTVRPENKIGYYDRLVNLDAEVCYTELIEIDLDVNATAQTGVTINAGLVDPIRLRYRATAVNRVDTVTAQYRGSEHFLLTDTGDIDWIADVPTPDTSRDIDNSILRFSVHYNMHPTWLIVEHPHVFRETPARKKVRNRVTPFGTPTAHPIQALARLEFLPKTDRDVKFT
jgi:hypothetical protein